MFGCIQLMNVSLSTLTHSRDLSVLRNLLPCSPSQEMPDLLSWTLRCGSPGPKKSKESRG